MKGKYSARAANRVARIDNELLQDALAEVTSLKAQLADRDRQLADERAERGARITHGANELSDRLIASARADALKTQEDAAAARVTLADWLVDYLNSLQDANPESPIFQVGLPKVLAQLVGNDRVGEYLSRILHWTNRDHRRLSRKNVRANEADSVRPDWAKGVSRRGFLEPVQ